MPYDDPDPQDPQELIGVELPGDERVTRDMAEAFSDEFAQLGYTGAQILALFRAPFYAGAHQAWQLLGEDAITRIVDDSLSVWGRVRRVVTDVPDSEIEIKPLRLIRSRS